MNAKSLYVYKLGYIKKHYKDNAVISFFLSLFNLLVLFFIFFT